MTDFREQLFIVAEKQIIYVAYLNLLANSAEYNAFNGVTAKKTRCVNEECQKGVYESKLSLQKIQHNKKLNSLLAKV